MLTHSAGSRPALAIVALASVVLFASGCAVVPPAEINAKYQDAISQRDQHYRLKEGDMISLELYSVQDSPLNQNRLLILSDGRSDLFLVGNEKLAGKSVADLEKLLKERLKKEIAPGDLRIQVQPAGEIVHIVGEVKKPASIPVTLRMTLQEALAATQGPTIFSDSDYALLRRPYRDQRHPDLFRIDLNDDSENLFLLPGDQVIVGRNAAATVILYIREYVFGFIPTRLLFAGI